MMDDWYFCNAIRLTPMAAHTHLDVVDALRHSSVTDDRLVLLALRALAGAEPSQLLHVVPDVLAVRSRRSTHLVDQEVRARLAEAFAVTPRSKGAVGMSDPEISTAEFRHQFEALLGSTAAVTASRPGPAYLDLVDYAPETLALAVAAERVTRDPVFRRFAEGYQPLTLLVDQALTGRLGRSAALSALRLRPPASRGAALGAVAQVGGIPWLEPDLMRVVATAWFLDGKQVDHDAIREESSSLVLLARLMETHPKPRDDHRSRVEKLLGCDRSETRGASTAIWRVVLADVAVDHDAVGAADWLREEWRLTDDALGPDADSPWIRRRGPLWTPNDPIPRTDRAIAPDEAIRRDAFRNDKSQYRNTATAKVVRLLGSAHVAARLVRAVETYDDVFVMLLLHAADVLVDVRHRPLIHELTEGRPERKSPNLSSPLIGLALHTHLVVKRLGANPALGLAPRRVKEAVTRAHDSAPSDSEVRALVWFAPAMVTAQWIFDAASGRTGVVDAKSEWFADGSNGERPHARAFLAWTVRMLQEEWESDATVDDTDTRVVSSPINRPALLLRQLWPDEPLTYKVDWPAAVDDPTDELTVSAERFLLNDPPLTVTEWLRLSDVALSRAGKAGGVLAMTTERLIAALTDSEATEVLFREWFDSWHKMISAINDPTQFRRDIRRRLADVAALPAPTLPLQSRLRDVLEESVDALVEFSVSSPNELWTLAEHLGESPGESPVELRNALRLRLLTAANSVTASGPAGAVSGPYDALAARENAVLRGRIIESVLSASSAHTDGLAVHYGDKTADPLLVPPTVPARSPDPRLALRAWWGSGQEVQVEHLPRRWLDVDGRVRGSVAGSTPRDDGTHEVAVNCGEGVPVLVTHHRALDIGEAVEITADGVRSIFELPKADPHDGEVRRAVVRRRARTGHDGSLPVVFVDDQPLVFSPKSPEEVLRRWDPDTSAAYRHDDSGEYPVLVTWDAALGWWLPADLTMAHLVSHLAQGADRTAEVFTVVDTWTTVEGRRWRLSMRPGVVFVVGGGDWVAGCPRDLDAVTDGADPAGLRITVGLHDIAGNQPRLSLHGEDFADERNLRWAALFGDYVTAEVHRGTGNWTVPVAVPGFPVTGVEVADFDEPADAVRCDLVVDGAGWSAWHQRTGRVAGRKVPTFSLTDVNHPSREVFDRVWHLEEGSRVTLAGTVGRYSEGGWTVRTTDGLSVRVRGESLTLRGISDRRSLDAALVDQRLAEVEVAKPWTPEKRSVDPMSTDELAGLLADPRIGSLLRRGRAPRALCAEIPEADTGGDELVTLWVEAGTDEIVHCHVPKRIFTTRPKKVGDRVELVQLSRSPGWWVLRARPRRVVVGALWEVEDRAEPDRELEYVATTGEDELTDVWQHERSGVLVCTPHLSTPDARRTRDEVRARLVGRPATRVKENSWDVRVTVRSPDGLHHPGTAESAPGGQSEVLSASIGIQDVGDGFAVYRVFQLRARQAPGADVADPAAMELKWNRHDLGDDLLGRMADADRTTVVIDGLHVPQGDGWTNRVPVAPGQESWVDGAYDDHDVRFVLSAYEGGYHAVYPAPLTPEQFKAHVSSSVRFGPHPVRLPKPLRYAGRTPGDQPGHRFEWGFGWRLEVPADQLLFRGQPVAAQSLFFGDVVHRMRFSHERGRLVLDVTELAVNLNPDRLLHEDAANRLVHRVEVEVDLDADTTRVVAAYARLRGYQPNDPDDSTRLLPHLAVLSPDTREWLLDLVRGQETSGTHRREILATFDSTAILEGTGRHLVLRRVSHLARGQRVFLTTGRGHVTRWKNDLYVEMTLPGGVSTDDGRPTVRVPRKAFPHRDGPVRKQHQAHTDDSLRDLVLLVDVVRGPGPDSALTGAVVAGLPRDPRDLRSLVAAGQGGCYAVVTNEPPYLGLEVRPGAHFSLPANAYEVIGQLTIGSVVRLCMLPGPDRVIEVRHALRGDGEYVPKDGRPVVVLPNDELLRKEVRVGAVKADNFTVAGLPKITAGALTTTDGTAIMRADHPKVAVVRPAPRPRRGFSVVTPAEAPLVGSVLVDSADRTASVRPIGGADPIAVPWARLSFADVGATRIAASCSARRWGFHNQFTGFWTTVADGKAIAVRRYYRRDPAKTLADNEVDGTITATRGPVFFDVGWSLRYRESQLRRFGFPVSAVLDGLSHEIRAKPEEYAVAAPVRSPGGGLWVETFPGRVLEISGELMVSPDAAHRPLADLDWARFSPGDRVRLSLHRQDGDRAGIARVVLNGWRPGPRGAFGFQRTLLPVAGVDDESGVVLGAGVWRLTYPLSTTSLSTVVDGRAVWLGPDNGLTPVEPGDTPSAGDVVLLRADPDTGPAVHGLDGFTVSFTGPAADWLVESMAKAGTRNRLLRALGDALPVTVESVDGTALVVSTRTQPLATPAPDKEVNAGVLGLLDDRLVLLRSGGALLTVDVDRLVPGLPPALRQAVVTALRSEESLYFHADAQGRLHAGVSRPPAGTAEVVLRHAVRVPGKGNLGVLCQDTVTLGWRWLPGSEIGWVDKLTAGEVRRMVELVTRHLTCAVLPDGRISLAGLPELSRKVGTLDPGNVVRIEVLAEREQGSGKQKRYLAMLHQTNVLVEFSTREARPTTSEPHPTEVAIRLDDPARQVLVVEQGQRRTKLDLPQDLVRRLRKLPAVTPDKRTEADQDLVSAVDAGDPKRVRPALARWLAVHGRPAVGVADAPLDLGAALSAILAAQAGGEEPLGRLAVWTAWRTGLAAMRSLHVEPIVAQWLARPDRLGDRRWQRLSAVGAALDVDGLMSQDQMRTLTSFCRGVLGRIPVIDESQLQEVASALLVATGQARRTDRALPLDGMLGRISALGRALTPDDQEETAQRELLTAQVRLVEDVRAEVTTENLALPLMPPLHGLTDARRGQATRLLAAARKALDEEPPESG